MIVYTFPKGETDPEQLMDRCVDTVEGFRSGAYNEALDAFLADENHGRISWDDNNIWVEVPDSIRKGQIQQVINNLSG